jgi:Zn-dependent M28 family amino/carboxypeptidase
MKFTIFLFTACLLQSQNALTPDQQLAIDHITANSLKGDVSFLSSDLLEGRDTPSAGLDIAAEFIASQFRKAGLEPLVEGSYLQTASMVLQKPVTTGQLLTVKTTGKIIVIETGIAARNESALELNGEPVWKYDAESLRAAAPADLRGKTIAIESLPAPPLRLLRQSPARLILIAGRLPGQGNSNRIVDKSRPAGGILVSVDDDAFRKALKKEPLGRTAMTLDISLPAPEEKPFKASNVVGLLRGSDPELSKTYVIVSGHYDHLGVSTTEGPDHIYNGANDDASGTASVIEIANSFAALKQRPKRSVLFLLFFGEEKGLIGSRYYADHPLLPLDKAVASLSLEQIGRTDEEQGPAVKSVRFTGQDFSDIPAIMRPAMKAAGVKIELDDAKRSTSFFSRSDNVSFAEKGIPAHTICVAYVYPDYHGLGDSWEKIDYENMQSVVRAIAAGILAIADNPAPPKWDKDNPAAARYAK